VQFDPDGQVIKTQTINEEGVNSDESTAASDSVSIQNSLPLGQDVQAASGNQNRNRTSNTEENVNYDNSNTTKTYVKEQGAIKRISIAVMVDGNYKKNNDGTQEYQARSEEELNKLKELVKTATGYKEDRGDVISLVNLKFSELPQDSILEEKEKPFFGLNINKLIELGITALVVLIGLLTVVKPLVLSLMKSISSSAKPSAVLTEKMLASIVANDQRTGHILDQGNNDEQINAEVPPPEPPQPPRKIMKAPTLEQSLINIDQIEGMVQQSSIKKIAELVDRHPDEAVSIIRTWMYSDR
jgi:flagellar M-ring protein FliF